ncbi:hypothetical protein ACMBCM_07570, partial [Spiroplasma sp. K1]
MQLSYPLTHLSSNYHNIYIYIYIYKITINKTYDNKNIIIFIIKRIILNVFKLLHLNLNGII